MNKTILYVLMLVLTCSFALAWGCDGAHCLVRAGSIYLQDVTINRDSYSQGYGTVIFNMDLNYIGGAKDLSQLGTANYWIYYFNNWYSSKYISLDDDGIYYEIQPVDDSIQFESTNFLGLPFYIQYCSIDCDYSGNANDCSDTTDRSVSRIFDYRDVYAGQNADIINLHGNDITGDTYSELIDTPNYLYTPGKVRVNLVHQCDWGANANKMVKVQCVIAPNPTYRHTSALDDDWTYDDIIPDKFPTIGSDVAYRDCMSVSVNMSANTFNPYNWSVSEEQDFLGINHGTTCIPIYNSAGVKVGENCYEWSGHIPNVVTDINANLSYQFQNLGLIKQAKSNNELINMEYKFRFQNKWITIVDTITSIILLIYYVLILGVITGLVFVKIPAVFKTVVNTFKEFMKIRRY
jgi:hypothetical protein